MAQKSANEAQSVADSKTKRQGCTSKTKFIACISMLQKYVLSLISTRKIAPKSQKIVPKGSKQCKRGPKSAKKDPNLTKIKKKDRAALLKQKFIAYISRLQKYVLNLISTPKIAQKIVPKGSKQCKRGPKCDRIKTSPRFLGSCDQICYEFKLHARLIHAT